MIKSLWAICCLVTLSGIALAQKTSISGIITDAETKTSIPGVTVIEKGTSNGTSTNEQGEFVLETSQPMPELLIQFIGYETQTVSYNGESLNIKLRSQSVDLNEVVVTALGIERERKALGYSVQKIDSRSINAVQETNIANTLAGRVAGVQTTNGANGTGSSNRVVIRGESFLSGSNQPLFVVDGMPISNQMISNMTENTESGFQEVDYGNGSAELSPSDIESMTVLKGPGAAALYGSRAANGVIVINTKDGGYDQGTTIEINSTVTFETPLTFPDYQNEYGGGSNDTFSYEDGLGAGANDGGITSFGPKLDGRLVQQFDSPSTDKDGNPVRGGDIIARDGNPITPTAWEARPNNVRDFFQTGVTAINNVAVGFSGKSSAFRVSFTRTDNKGILPNTDLRRNSFSLTARQKLSDKLTARSFVNFIQSESDNRPGLGYGSENPMYIFTWMGRQNNVESLEDYWQAGQEDFRQFNFNYRWMDNPYLTMMENTNAFSKNRLIGNVNLNYAFTDKLSFRVLSGVDYYADRRQSRRAFSSQRWQNGAYREDNINFTELNADTRLTYTSTIGEDWRYTAAIGANTMNQQSDYLSTTAGQLSVPGIYSFENSKIALATNQLYTQKLINSLYAFGQVAWRSKIFVDLTVRNDNSSTLPEDNNSYTYYSASGSAILSEFFELPEWISFLKYRASAASVGNDTDPYQLENTYRFNQNYGAAPLLTNASTLLNSDLLPERLDALETGAEIWFWQNRLALEATVYQNTSKNQIIAPPTSAASGFQSRIINGGTIQSRGIELSVNAVPVRTENFQWTVFSNYSRNRAIVKELPEDVEQYVTGFTSIYSSTDRSVFYIAQEGGRLGDMYGTGLKMHDGQVVYDQNGIPVRDPNLQLLGNYNPDFIVGFGNELTYKNLSFSFLFDWRQGGVVLSRTRAVGSTSGVLAETLEGREDGIVGEGVVNVGTEENPVYETNTTNISAGNYYNQFYNRANETTSLYDASYLKLRQVAIKYELPIKLVSRLGLNGAEVGFVARNLWLLTENPHFDPETTTLQGRSFAYGVEDMAYPSTRSYGFSINIKL